MTILVRNTGNVGIRVLPVGVRASGFSPIGWAQADESVFIANLADLGSALSSSNISTDPVPSNGELTFGPFPVSRASITGWKNDETRKSKGAVLGLVGKI